MLTQLIRCTAERKFSLDVFELRRAMMRIASYVRDDLRTYTGALNNDAIRVWLARNINVTYRALENKKLLKFILKDMSTSELTNVHCEVSLSSNQEFSTAETVCITCTRPTNQILMAYMFAELAR